MSGNGRQGRGLTKSGRETSEGERSTSRRLQGDGTLTWPRRSTWEQKTCRKRASKVTGAGALSQV